MNQDFKIFGKRLFFFSLSVIGLYVFFIMIWGFVLPKRLTPNLESRNKGLYFLNTRLREVKQVKNIDILFVGSSHTYRGFDTRKFERAGIRNFNLGSSAQTPLQSEMLIKKYIDHLKPKLVVVDVFPMTSSIDGVESALEILNNDRIDISSVVMVSYLPHIKVINTFIFHFFRQCFLSNEQSEPLETNKDRYIKGGFVERKMGNYRQGPIKPFRYSLSVTQSQSLNRIAKFLKQRDIQFLLVYVPVTRNMYYSVYSNNMFHAQMRAVGTYVDFNMKITLNDSLNFYDADHMNQSGVELFNDSFIQWLNSTRLIE
jgi:hypothetical protein